MFEVPTRRAALAPTSAGRVRRRSPGQSLVEYLILLALVAVAAIGVVSLVGTNLREQYANVSKAIRGERGSVSRTRERREDYEARGLDDFMESAAGGRR